MPSRRRRNPTARPQNTRVRLLNQNAREEFIETKIRDPAFANGRYNPALLRKTSATYKRLAKGLKTAFADLPIHKQRLYQYRVEKRWPLWFERPNVPLMDAHMHPGPERVMTYEHVCFNEATGVHRGQYLAQRRAELPNMHPSYIQRIQTGRTIIEQSRGVGGPHTPNAPAVPGNNTNNTIPPGPGHAAHDVRNTLQPPAGALQWTPHRILKDVEAQGTQVCVYRQGDPLSNVTRGVVVIKKTLSTTNHFAPLYPGGHLLNLEEVLVHRAIQNNCPAHVVNLINGTMPGTYAPTILYKLLALDWVPYGDLDALIAHYKASSQLIPEPFIWYCFKVLTEVSLVGWNGHAARGMRAGWDRIVNLDIKPQNILLDVNNATEPMLWARQYPHPKVTDFGLAFFTEQGRDDLNHATPWRQRQNPPDFDGYGTPGQYAPEMLGRNVQELQSSWIDPANCTKTLNRLNTELTGPTAADPLDYRAVHSWTMVWEIGMVMWQMLSGQRHGGINSSNNFVVDFSEVNGRRDYPPWFCQVDGVTRLRPAYSGRLVELVYQCMAFHPKNRIDLEDLWDEVSAGCMDITNVYGLNQQAAPPAGPNPVSHVPDKYPVGQNVLNDVPGQ